jgi:cytochrome c oxidase subunit III
VSRSRVIRKEELPDLVSGRQAPVWWGMIVLIAIESTVFATFFAGYFYLRFNSPEWPPPGTQQPGLLGPLLNTGVLFASAAAVFWASTGMARGDLRRLKVGLGIGVALEIVFLGVKLILAAGYEFTWTDHAYGSIFLVIDRLHTVHVVAAILMGVIVLILAMRGYFTTERRLGVQAVNLYWQFVTVVWVPVFFVLYFVPRWF